MAKGINKTISIFLDGKAVENSSKAIREALAKATNEINNMTIGTKQYIDKSKQIEYLKKILNEHNAQLKSTGSLWDKLKEKGKEFQGLIQGAFFISRAASNVQSWMQEYVAEFSKLDKAMAETQRYTKMTREEVKELNDELKKLDTTTPVEQLHKLAAKAGDLGYTSKEDVLKFVDAADKMNKVLGSNIGEEAAAQITKLTQVFGTDKTMGVQGATLATASAINELDKQTSASAKDILEFTTNLSAVGKAAGLTQADIIGLGATLTSKLQDGGASAVQLTKLLTKMYTDPSKFAKAAGMEVKQFANLIKTDANGALLQLFDNISQKGGLESLVPMFNELGIGAAKGVKIFSTLADNVNDLRKNQELANQTYREGTSIVNDFNLVNETRAAQLEKAKNAVTDAKAELGESLIPIMTKLTEGTAEFFSVLSTGAKFIVENRELVMATVAALATYWAIKNRNLLLEKAEIALAGFKNKAKREAIALDLSAAAATAKATATEAANTLGAETNLLARQKLRLEKAKGTQAAYLQELVLKQEAVVRNAATRATITQTAATVANTQALHAQRIAMASSPWGWILLAAGALVGIIAKITKNLRESNAALREFNKEAAVQTYHVKELFDQLGKLKKGTEEYNAVQKEIIDTYPDLLKNQVDEHGNLINLKDAYDLVVKSIETKIAQQKLSAAIDKIIEDSMDKQTKYLQNFPVEIQKQIKALADAGKSADEILEEINKKLAEPIKKVASIRTIYDDFGGYYDIESYSEDYKNLQKIVGEVKNTVSKISEQKAKLSPFITAGDIIEETELEKLQKKLTALKNEKSELWIAEKKKDPEIESQIKELEKQIKKLQEVKKTVVTGDITGDDLDAEAKKKIEALKKFEDEVAKLREQQRINQLTDFEKTRAQIEKQYNDLIEKSKQFGAKGKEIAEKLETEKGEAVVAAAQKYLEKYSDVAKKLQDEMLKLAEKTAPSSQESKLINDLLGSEKEWNEKINAIKTHLEVLEDMYSNATTEEEKAEVQKKQDELFNIKLEAEYQLQIARTNIIKKYTEETADFVKQKTDEQYLASLSAEEKEEVLLERQKKAVKDRYDEEIKKTKELLAEKKKLGNATKDEIKQLEDLLKELEKLKANSDIEIEVSIKKDDDWRDKLKQFASDFQEIAGSITSIMDSMNQIAINNMQKELNAFKKSKDAELSKFKDTKNKEKKSLDEQVNQGIISQEYYNAQVEKMNEEVAAEEQRIVDEKEAKELALKKEQFRRDKQAAIIKAIISGAVAVMQTLSQWGMPWGLIPAALMVAATAAEIAVISSQPEPYKLGGFTGKKKNRMIQVNEDGEEWIASNKLLQNKETAPLIQALEKFQTGDKTPLRELVYQTSIPNGELLSQAASTINHNFTTTKTETVIEKHYVTSNAQTQNNDDMIASVNKLNKFLDENKVLEATLNRELLLRFTKNEDMLKKLSKIK